MSHPSVAEILADSDEVRAHVEACTMCRSLATLAEPAARDVERGGDQELPIVDRAMYADFEELPGGRGGMGQLFRARDVRLGRVVAIKQLHEPAERIDPASRVELRRRFEREARLTSMLEHPAIVGVHEAGRWPDGEPFYAMRFVDGRPLDEEIAAREGVHARLTLLAGLTIVADALAYAHGQGIVHRDVKPKNILLGSFGETVLIDWGLAKKLGGKDSAAAPLAEPCETQGSLTQLGVGTPQYMPPEQARGAPADVRMDVYALGATIYHALAGVPPYGTGSSTDLRRELIGGPPRSLAQLAPDVPPEIQAIVAKAMDRDPAKRFPTARELADELHRYQNGQLLKTHRYTARELVTHWARRHATAIRIAAIAAAALGLFGAWSVARVVRERNRAEGSEREARRALWRAQGITASRLATSSATRLDALALGVASVAPALEAGEEAPWEAVQGLFDAIVEGPARANLGEPHAHASGLGASPSVGRVAVASDDGLTEVWDMETFRSVARRRFSMIPNRLYLSPDGTRLVGCGTTTRAEAWTVGAPTSTTIESTAVIVDCGFLSNDRIVTAADAVVVWDPGGHEVQRLPLRGPASSFAIAPDGRVAVGTMDGAVTVWNPTTNATATARAHTLATNALRFASGGSMLASVGVDGALVTYEPDPAGKVTRVSSLDTSFGAGLGVSRSGRFVATATNQGYSRAKILVYDRERPGAHAFADGWIPGFADDESLAAIGTGGDFVVFDPVGWRELLRVDGQTAFQPVFARGNERLVVHDFQTAQVFVWDVRPGAATGLLLGHSNEIVGAWPSPDRARFLTASLDGTARVWDARSGLSIATLDATAPLAGALWGPDGTWVLTAGLDGVARAFGVDGSARARVDVGVPIVAAAIARDGRTAVVASADGSLVVWETSTGAVRMRIASASAGVAATFSPDGARVVAGSSDGFVRAWDASGGALLTTSPPLDPQRMGVSALFFTRDGAHLLASLSSGKSLLLDPASLGVERELEGRAASAWVPPFDGDGRRFVASARDGRVLVHNLSTSDAPVSLTGDSTALQAVFSDDGERIATGDVAGAVRVWDAKSGALLSRLAASRLGEATALAFAPDRRFVLVGYGTGGLRLHPVTLDAALERACGTLAVLGRKDTRYCDVTRKFRNENGDR